MKKHVVKETHTYEIKDSKGNVVQKEKHVTTKSVNAPKEERPAIEEKPKYQSQRLRPSRFEWYFYPCN